MKKSILTTLLCAAALCLNAQSYKVTVTTTDGQKHTYETADVSKITFADAPAYNPAEYVYQAEYRTQEDLGVYKLRLATCPIGADNEPAIVGGVEIDATLYAPQSADRLNAELPLGYYLPAQGPESMKWDITKSGLYLRLEEGSEGISTQVLADGSIDVRRSGSEYDIRMEVTLLTGETVNLQYNGPLKFALSNLESDKFTEDINVELNGCQGRFYANWFYPFCTDMMLQLYNGSFSTDGLVQVEGYWLNIPIYMPKREDVTNPNQSVTDGVYTVETRNLNSYFNIPFTWQYGRMVDLWGIISPADAYVTYTSQDGTTKRALLTSGTLTVSDDGQTFVFDMDTDIPGVHFHGTFSGEPDVHNFCDNSAELLAVSTLTEDYKLDLDKGQMAFAFKNDGYIVPGLTWYEIYVTDPAYANYDYLQIHVLTDAETLRDGTYTIDNGLTSGTGLKGAVTPGGEISLSWMSDLSSADSEGVQSVLAPIAGGTVTISTVGDFRQLDFDLVDNAGHKITGTYKGSFGEFSAEDMQAPALKAPKK